MTDRQLEELENVRKLLMLLLYKMGATQDEVATALDVTQARVSQMLPTTGIRPAKVECLGTEEQR